MKKFKAMTLAMCLMTVFSCSTKQGTGVMEKKRKIND